MRVKPPSAEIFRQLLRFTVGGGGVAALSVFVYWLCAVPLAITPMIANLISYLVHVTIGFNVHRLWSFQGYGNAVPFRSAAPRYFAISLCALAMNSLWVWGLTGLLGLPAWTPIAPMVSATPLVTFILTRRWAFAVRRVNHATETVPRGS